MKRYRGLPATVVFYVVALLAAAAAAAVWFKGVSFVLASGAACLLILAVLYVNERSSFIRSREMPRAFEPRRNFSPVEVLLLIFLLMLNLSIDALVLVAG